MKTNSRWNSSEWWDIYTGYFPGKFLHLANAFKVSRTTVKNTWQHLHMERTTEPRHGGGRNSNLTQGDLQLIETIKREMPITERNLQWINWIWWHSKGNFKLAISHALNNNMLSGLKYSWEKISTVAEERFIVENMAYTQMFIDLYKLNILVTVCEPWSKTIVWLNKSLSL